MTSTVGVALAITAVIASGCVRTGAFVCSRDQDCTLAGVQGTCEPVGFCSFPDSTCSDGWRYGEQAGAYARQCVNPDVPGDGGLDAPVDGGPDSSPSTTGIVISELFESGGKSNMSYEFDYAVLRNIGSTGESLAGWSFQHYKTGQGWKVLALPGSTIPAGGTFLLRLYNDGNSTGMALPAPDLSAPSNSDWNLSTQNGEAVAVVNTTSVLTSCSSATIVDLVGYNASPPCVEGAAAPTSTDTLSAHRKNGGTQDTDDNAADFVLAAATP